MEVAYIQEKFGIVATAVDFNRQFCGRGLVAVIAWIEEQTDLPVPEDMVADLSQRKIDVFQQRLSAVSHMAEVLHRLAGVLKCVASNTPLPTVEMALQSTGLFSFFMPYIYSAQMVPRGKPAPDLFLFAARMLQVDPADCIVIEDSIHGIAAARAANMRVFGFAGGGHCIGADYKDKLHEAELVFTDMRELPILAGLS